LSVGFKTEASAECVNSKSEYIHYFYSCINCKYVNSLFKT
jgi:hypothetical protein